MGYEGRAGLLRDVGRGIFAFAALPLVALKLKASMRSVVNPELSVGRRGGKDARPVGRRGASCGEVVGAVDVDASGYCRRADHCTAFHAARSQCLVSSFSR